MRARPCRSQPGRGPRRTCHRLAQVPGACGRRAGGGCLRRRCAACAGADGNARAPRLCGDCHGNGRARIPLVLLRLRAPAQVHPPVRFRCGCRGARHLPGGRQLAGRGGTRRRRARAGGLGRLRARVGEGEARGRSPRGGRQPRVGQTGSWRARRQAISSARHVWPLRRWLPSCWR